MLRFVTGNIFDAQVDAIVNTVNLVGVMGKGIALQFKERFKQNYLLYRRACREQSINIGNSLVTIDQHQGRQVYLINFPTKVHWRSRSEYSYIDKGLDNLIDIINTYGIKSIAIPPLGAGNGGLDWELVKEKIITKLSNVDCECLIYEPGHKAETQEKKVKLTPARALLVYMLDHLKREGQEATPFSAVKTVYFLQKFGAKEIFNLEFKPYIYGPYSDKVRHILHSIDGAYVRGFADMSKKPFEPFDTIEEKIPEAIFMVEHDIQLADITNRTIAFLQNNWDDFSLELISSVDFLMERHPNDSMEEIHEKLCAWTPRKKALFADKSHTRFAYNLITATN
ncbi:MAG: macro domain-containing protein [Bacteroidales bacterium]|nr:macro domain-containing protein [Bacteroidales bacterium]